MCLAHDGAVPRLKGAQLVLSGGTEGAAKTRSSTTGGSKVDGPVFALASRGASHAARLQPVVQASLSSLVSPRAEVVPAPAKVCSIDLMGCCTVLLTRDGRWAQSATARRNTTTNISATGTLTSFRSPSLDGPPSSIA